MCFSSSLSAGRDNTKQYVSDNTHQLQAISIFCQHCTFVAVNVLHNATILSHVPSLSYIQVLFVYM